MERVLAKIKEDDDESALEELECVLAEYQLYPQCSLAECVHLAVVHNCEQVIRRLHQIWPTAVDFIGEKQRTPLHTAAIHGCIDMIYLLDELGTTSKNAYDIRKKTPMELAVTQDNEHAIKALHRIGCTFEIHSLNNDWNIVGVAIHARCFKSIRALLEFERQLLFANACWDRSPLEYSLILRNRDLNISELILQLEPRTIDLAHSGLHPLALVVSRDDPDYFKIFLLFHRYGSEDYFDASIRGGDLRYYVDNPAYRRESLTSARLRRFYFSRSLAEVLFFALEKYDSVPPQ